MSERLLVERGIGEDRFARINGDTIIEAWIERHGTLRHGHVYEGRLTRKLGQRGEAAIGAETVLLDPWPEGLTEGATAQFEIVREAVPEQGRDRSAKARPAPDGLASSKDESAETVGAHAGATNLDAYGWSELVEEARTGVIPFDGGLLAIVPTPAGTTIDIDGALPVDELALRGAGTAAQAVRRLGIAGSILIDLPSLEGKTARQATAEAFDAHMPQPFERTGVNGFGLLQVVRPRLRASLIEYMHNQTVESGAYDLLRRAEHAGATRTLELRAGVTIQTWLAAHTDLLKELARRTGTTPALKPHGNDPLWWGDVHSQ